MDNMSSIRYNPFIDKPFVKSGLFRNRVYQNKETSENKGAGFRSYSNFTGRILEKLGFAEKMQWENQEKTKIYVNKNSFCKWTIRVNEMKKQKISFDGEFSISMNISYRDHKKTGTGYELLSAVKKLFEDKVGKGEKAVEIQSSISKYIKDAKIKTVETLIYFLNKREFYKEEGIFRVPGKKIEIDELLAKFKKNTEYQIPDGILSTSIGGALKKLFRDLDPVLFDSVEEEYLKINAQENEENKLKQLKTVVGGLPEENKKLLKLLLEFLSNVLEEKEVNKMKESNLAIIFGAIMIDIQDPVEALTMSPQLNETFQFLLEKRDDVLEWL